MRTWLIGSIMVPDLSNPRPEDVDLPFLRYRLMTIRRFTGHPAALFVGEHQVLCGIIAADLGMSPEVVEWAQHHDDREYAVGDISTPTENAIGAFDLPKVKERWDVAICRALGLALPTAEVREEVALVDKVALAMEWRHCLGRDVAELGVSDQVERLSRSDHLVGFVLEPERYDEIAGGRRFLAA